MARIAAQQTLVGTSARRSVNRGAVVAVGRLIWRRPACVVVRIAAGSSRRSRPIEAHDDVGHRIRLVAMADGRHLGVRMFGDAQLVVRMVGGQLDASVRRADVIRLADGTVLRNAGQFSNCVVFYR